MQKPLVLIDGSSYFFRAFHALPPLSNSKGQPLGAVYGVVNMVNKLIKDYQPEKLAVVFDAKGKTFRDEMYSDYKANRPPMPEELSCQFQPMIDVLDAMGLPLLIIEGVEADDVIGTLATLASQKGMATLISTGDKDLAQLVDQHTTLINTMSNTTMDIAGVEEKFGVPPELIIDYLALIGDKSDNVPGVNKVGPKTAVKWLNLYGNLDGVVENATEITGKVGEYLRDGLEQLSLSKKLVTIKTDLELPLTLDELAPIPANIDRLYELYQQYEFNTWLRQLKSAHNLEDEEVVEVETNYQVIQTEQALAEMIDKLKLAKIIAIDTETTSLNALSAELVGLSFSADKHQAYYIPVAHKEGEQLAKQKVLQALDVIFSDESIKKVGQNLKYDLTILRNEGVSLKGTLFDTMLESYILNSAQSRHDMDSMAKKYLQIETIKFEDIAGKGSKQVTFDEIEIAKAGEYAAEDADITLQLHKYLMPRVKAIPKLRQVFEKIEMPLMPIIAEMEYQGVLIDSSILAKQSVELSKQLEELQTEAYAIAGKSFNMNSPKQLQSILFEELGLPIIKKTPKGQPSTAENVLQELAYDYPLPSIILKYRSLYKLLTTYVDALPKRINAKTGRVHTSYNQAVTATGRLSSSEPNLQNIPIRTPEGRAIRNAFIAPAGSLLLACDYSQIELRIMAHLSRDEGLLQAFSAGQDIHKATASEVFDVALDKVTPEQRRRSKAVNFGLIYGMSAFGLSKQLGIERHEAQQYIDMYFAKYPGVLAYMEATRKKAHEFGFVETIKGRRLYLPDINAKNKMLVKAAERTAINAPMQGTAADIIKQAMIDIFAWQQTCDLDIKMVMQVHDELVFEVKTEHVDVAKEKIQELMENAVQLDVPLEVAIDQGANWEEAH
jgi:DNA polymerase-1